MTPTKPTSKPWNPTTKPLAPEFGPWLSTAPDGVALSSAPVYVGTLPLNEGVATLRVVLGTTVVPLIPGPEESSLNFAE
jgi:hypothetical protein